MITRENIIHFYTKYKENLKREDHIQENLLKADDQEIWIENLKNKSRVMRRLYIENEALLNLYIRPFLDGEARLSDELARELLHQIRMANDEGYEDNLAMLEVLELLDEYFQNSEDLDSYIWTLNLLGNLYNRPFSDEDGKKGMMYYNRIRALSSHYFEIEDFDVRKRILYSYYNFPVVMMNFNLGTAKELLQCIDEALVFYNDGKIRALDGERFDFDGLIEELNYDLLGNSVLRFTVHEIDPALLSRATDVLGYYYQQELEKNPNPYEMLDEIYCNYKSCLFYQGKITCTELLEDYRKFCEYSMENDGLDSQEGVSFSDSRYFQVVINHLPTILELVGKYGDDYHGAPDIREFCVTNYVSTIRRLSRTKNDTFVNDVVWRSLGDVLKYVTGDEVDTLVLMQIMLSREEGTAMHSAMVEQIARHILNAVIKKRPELLIGTLGYENVVEVLENQENLLDFVSQSALLLDLGMIRLASIVNKQSRQLTKRERQDILTHPEESAKFIEEIPCLRKYKDAVLGHHKSWDGKIGYPAEFDNTRSDVRFLIEIIHISDCLDAATDFIGRSYKLAKKLNQVLEEFSQGKGSLYCPELVELLEEDEGLQADLSYLLGAGRIRTCYSVYGKAVDPNEAETARFFMEMESWDAASEKQSDNDGETILDFLHQSGSETRQLLHAVARNSLIILYVDMMSGEYKVSYRGSQRLLDKKIPDGYYGDFLKEYLAPNCEPSDWEKVRLKLKLSELSHTFLEQEESYECEARIKAKEAYRWVRFQFIRLDDENVMPGMMALIATDVQESHSRNEQLMNSLKDAYKSAEEANKAKSVFLSSMSHDIRTPMNGILGMTQIAMNHLDDPERIRDCLQKIDDSSRHLLELINEVLDMSKIESGDTVLHEEPLSLIKAMEIVDGVCRPAAMEKKQILDMDMEEIRDAYVLADPVRLRQVLINLISNAVKYTPEHGRVRVKVTQSSSLMTGRARYTFVVRDNGIGMSREFQEKLFEPFSREDNSMTNATQGTGLGLSIAKSIISQMGGNIEVASQQGKGTTFIVCLELTLAAKEKKIEAAVGETETGEEKERDLAFLRGRRIMLVEDNELNREIAYELLSEPGLIVDVAENGQEAIRLLGSHPEHYYELIFMDIQMPVLNGYETTESIRAGESDYWKNIPVIAMTANVFPEDENRAAECGMSGYITKPIDMEVIYSVLEKWLPKNYNS